MYIDLYLNRMTKGLVLSFLFPDTMTSPEILAENEKTPLQNQTDVSVKFNESLFEV